MTTIIIDAAHVMVDPTVMSSSSSSGPRVLVLGFGALGALYGFLLARGGAQVYAVARSNAESLRRDGINIRSGKHGAHDGFKPAGVLASPEEVRAAAPFDYVLCTVKICPEQRQVGEWIRTFLPSGKGKDRSSLPTVVFVENGIGIEEEPYEALCQGDDPVAGTIISCCAWLGATLVNGGKTVEHGPLERLEMGLYPHLEKDELAKAPAAWRNEKLRLFAETYKNGGGGAEMMEGDIQPKRWIKRAW